LIFMDGTANTWTNRTNVRRLFEVIAAQENPKHLCFYVDGVGTQDALGKVAGFGLKPRVLKAYEFLAENYREGDRVYVFGFSRGAHAARTLCGLVAHCGVPNGAEKRALAQEVGYSEGAVWDFCEKNLHEPPIKAKGPEVRQKLRDNQELVARRFPGLDWREGKIQFLGLWDTVPALHFTNISDDGEVGVKDGRPERYKIRPYPNIKTVAHAIAIDELRSQFRAVRVGPPLDPGSTKVYEVWFPGAHSDVGGGYQADSNDLAGISLDWMLDLLKSDSLLRNNYQVYADPKGIIHHPEMGGIGSWGSRSRWRAMPEKAVIHPTFLTRVRASPEGLYAESRRSSTGYVKEAYRPNLHVKTGDSVTPVDLWVRTNPDEPASWQFKQATFDETFKLYRRDRTDSGLQKGAPLTIEVLQQELAKVTLPVATVENEASAE
jgi:hypothetical protein